MIRRFYVHNFRCLENFDLGLAGLDSVLLLGRNGAGKSTVGSALEILTKIARGSNRVGDLVKPGDMANGRAEAPMRFEIEVDLTGSTYVYSIAFEFPSGFRELRVLDESLHVAGQPVFTRALAEIRIARDDLTPEATFRIDWHLVALPIVQEQSNRDPISIFKNWLRRALILRPVPSLFRGTSDSEASLVGSLDTRGVDIGAWFSDMIATSPDTYSKVGEHLAQVMPDFQKITNSLIGKNVRSMSFHFARSSDKIELGLAQLSDGEKCFVLYSLVMAASVAHSPLLCFWDEPDNFLAPDEVGQSIIGLRRAFQNRGQLVITSHNPEAIRRFSDDSTYYLARRSHLEPTTYRTVRAMRETNEYEGSFLDALIRGDIGVGTEGQV